MKKTITAEYRCDYCNRAFNDLARCTHHEAMCKSNPYQFARSKEIMNKFFKYEESDGFTSKVTYLSPYIKSGDRLYTCNSMTIDKNSEGVTRVLFSTEQYSVGDIGDCVPVSTADFIKAYTDCSSLFVQAEADAQYKAPTHSRCTECLDMLGDTFVVHNEKMYCMSCASKLGYLK